jgi:hypothetical protein
MLLTTVSAIPAFSERKERWIGGEHKTEVKKEEGGRGKGGGSERGKG